MGRGRPKKGSEWERILICSDLHGPYLDKKAYSVFLAVASSFPWSRVIANGDFADFSQLSSHERKIGAYQRQFIDDFTLEQEIFAIKHDIVAPLRKAVGKDTKIQFRLGNHDSRYLVAAENNSKALAEMVRTMKRHRSIDLEDVLEFDRYGVELSYNPEDTLYGTFTLVHGVKSTKNVAKANLGTYGSGTSGHSHRLGCYTETQRGTLQGWWESGCLRTTKHIEYLPFGARPDWANGYLELHINKNNGHFFVIPHFIIDHQTVHDGQLFAA